MGAHWRRLGLWAAVSEQLRHLGPGVERADSWAVDAHEWLNVPYDSGLVLCAHPQTHRAALGIRAEYLIHTEEDRFASNSESRLLYVADGVPVEVWTDDA